MATFDLDRVRARFPGLAGDWILMDNAGGSQVLDTVAQGLHDYLLHTNVQLGASSRLSMRSAEAVNAGAEAAARLVGTPDSREVVLGSSATQLLVNLAYGLTRLADDRPPYLQAGDRVIVSQLEHETNAGPWYRLKEHGIDVVPWKIDDAGALTVDALDRAWGPRTRLVCFTHVSNLLGEILPVAELTREIQARGARVMVDGVAYAPHRRVRAREWGVDYYVFSLYKVYGPHQAVLYGKAEHLLELPKLNHDFLADEDIPYKLQPGGVQYEVVASLTAIPEYLDELAGEFGEGGRDPLDRAFDAIARHEEALAEPLVDFLQAHPRVTIHGPATADRHRRVPTVGFTVEGMEPAEVVAATDRAKIAIRHGHFYSHRLAEALGLGEGGLVRASLVHYNTEDEVAKLIETLDHALAANGGAA